ITFQSARRAASLGIALSAPNTVSLRNASAITTTTLVGDGSASVSSRAAMALSVAAVGRDLQGRTLAPAASRSSEDRADIGGADEAGTEQAGTDQDRLARQRARSGRRRAAARRGGGRARSRRVHLRSGVPPAVEGPPRGRAGALGRRRDLPGRAR